MSEQQNFGFGKFVPGFDFLQNLGKGTPQQAMPNLSSWVAPTMNVEELDKRIGELKAVSFWLDQNAKALAATIQALELQKMTLATLKGMKFNMNEIAAALQLNTDGSPGAADSSVSDDRGVDRSAAGDGSVAGAAKEAVAKSRASRKDGQATSGNGNEGKTESGAVVDPLQWWGALTTQFQEIAAGALREAAKNAAAADMADASKAAAKPSPATRKTAASGTSAPAKSAAGRSSQKSR